MGERRSSTSADELRCVMRKILDGGGWRKGEKEGGGAGGC